MIKDSAERLLLEARFRRVVRGGKVVRKFKARKGFRIVRRGDKIKQVRMTFMEKKMRHLKMMKVWRKGHAARVVKSKRKRVISLRKRKSLLTSLMMQPKIS
jgi:hypothetical protein